MKRITIAIAVALAGFATVAQAAPRGNTWYVGSKLGWSQFHGTGWYNSSLNDNGPTHENQLGAGVFGDYQVNPYLGLEMGYDWLGCMPYKGDQVNGASKVQDVQLTAKLGYPITDDLDIYIHLGGMVWRADSSNNIASDNHDTSVPLVSAGGVEWAVTRDIAIRLECQWVNNIGNADTVGVRPDSGMLSVGVSCRFDQEDAAPVVAPAPAPAPEVTTKRFILKSDVLFNFSKATLKLEGQQALDQLHTQLSNMDPKDGSAVIMGFTDRTGSEAYSQQLSEKCAQSVVSYLVAKGIPADEISVRGTGKSNPVTGNTCDNVKVCAALIDCSTLDRRVEVEVKGYKEVVTQPAA